MENRLHYLKQKKLELKKVSFNELLFIVKDVIESYGEEACVESYHNQNFFTCLIDDNKTLLYFASDIEQMEIKHKDIILEIVNDLNVDKTIVVCNISGFDEYIISCLPIEGYLGVDTHDLEDVLDILIEEEEILSKDICCPYCGSRRFEKYDFTKDIFYDDIYENFCEKRGSLSSRIKSFSESLMIQGLECICINCKEEFVYSKRSDIRRSNFPFTTVIDRKTYFDAIEEIFNETIAMIIRKNKFDATTFYQEDLYNLLKIKMTEKSLNDYSSEIIRK